MADEPAKTLDAQIIDAVLVNGELEVLGRLVDASNATLLTIARLDGVELQCVYKPTAGERPLWDFPDGDLAKREVATFELSQALGWSLIPRTKMRADGPYGGGMVQQWIDVDTDVDLVDVVAPDAVPEGWLSVLEARDGDDNPVVLVHADRPELQQLTLLDAIANNGDRKGGHVIISEDHQVFGIDHGVTWHAEDKLRTVLWGWTDADLPDNLLADVSLLLAGWAGFAATLSDLLPAQEVEAAHLRIAALAARKKFPLPSPEWPAIPWPVF